jgi:hypothetical protein
MLVKFRSVLERSRNRSYRLVKAHNEKRVDECIYDHTSSYRPVSEYPVCLVSSAEHRPAILWGPKLGEMKWTEVAKVAGSKVQIGYEREHRGRLGPDRCSVLLTIFPISTIVFMTAVPSGIQVEISVTQSPIYVYPPSTLGPEGSSASRYDKPVTGHVIIHSANEIGTRIGPIKLAWELSHHPDEITRVVVARYECTCRGEDSDIPPGEIM